ncbi:MAG: SRPBCC family protein [Rhodobacteraceae bacterium]|nr:SRPBCC family protein [Paracoccaceae bacterium]
MRPFRILCAALLLLLPSMALAHGPVRQKVSVAVDVAASPAEAWAVIGDFQDMSWLPPVFDTTGEGGNEPGATRLLTLGDSDGPVVAETLRRYSADKMSYSYLITDVDVAVLPVTNYSSTLTVTPNDGGGAHIEWKGAFYRGYPNNDPPAELNDEAAVAAVTGLYETGLAALAEKLDQ